MVQTPDGMAAIDANIVRLQGQWRIACDPDNQGRTRHWLSRMPDATEPAPVPGIIQQVFPAYHGVAWYWRTFRIDHLPAAGERLLLRFGAVDYLAEVWVNGKAAGSFEGGETPFSLDISDLLSVDNAEQLLAVRVLNPTDTPIDGYVLEEIPHRNKVMQYSAGSSFNTGGIMYPVELIRVPVVRISDIFPRPDIRGNLTLTVTLQNDTGSAIDGCLRAQVGEATGAEYVLGVTEECLHIASGESVHHLAYTVPQPRLWNLDDPFLYRISITLDIADVALHQRSVRCGFRDFRLIDGFFHLNGKRLFLKCAHTGNHTPMGQVVAVLPDHVRRDVINAKACGFNTIRFISGMAWPEQLDFCDEIGLMVIESTLAGWTLGRSHCPVQDQLPVTPEIAWRYDHSMSQMILRDRHHASVVAWELLNETHNGAIFDRAVAFLPKARALDTTRMVMLNSGRFDNRFDIGSCSNPGADSWEHVWGVEAPDGPRLGADLHYPSRTGAGDFHLYPLVPHTPQTMDYLRHLGNETRPVLLSEYGIGSLYDVIGEWRHYESIGARVDLEDAAIIRAQCDKLYADWQRLGLDAVYPFPEEMLRESQRLNARQRTLGFNLIRANPQLCGFNLTGLLDHAICGEGLWKFWREWKPEMFDAVCDGWSPLRWCLFADPMHAYAGREVTVEAVLATEDALPPGEYPARFRVFGPHGMVWEQSAMVSIPENPPLAVPVLRETFRLEGPAGAYRFCANLERGGAASGGALTFHVSDPTAWPCLAGSAQVWGLDEDTIAWLTAHGLSCRPFTPQANSNCLIILVGLPDEVDGAAGWELLWRRVQEEGATVLFLNANLFKDNAAAMERLPLQEQGKCIGTWDWLYRKECVANRHPVFAGLPAPGMMDIDYYGQVLGHTVFIEQSTPDETICAGFNTGYHAAPGGYRASLLIAAYRAGKGRFVLNAFDLLSKLDTHPATDRLLVNLIRYADTKGLGQK